MGSDFERIESVFLRQTGDTCIAAAVFPDLFRAIVLVDPVFLVPLRLAMIGLMRVLGLAGRLPRARAARRRRKSFRSKAEALKLFMSGRVIFKTWSPEFVEAYLECGLLEKEPDSTVLTCDPELEAQIFESIPITVWRYVRRLRSPAPGDPRGAVRCFSGGGR